MPGPCPEKEFAFREVLRRARFLLLVLGEAEESNDLESKIAASQIALTESQEIAAVLRRVMSILERCRDA